MIRHVASSLLVLLACAAFSQAPDSRRSPEVDEAIRRIRSMDPGKSDRAVQRFDSVLRSYNRFDAYPLSRADVLIEKGRKEQDIGQIQEAIQSFTASFNLYDSLGHRRGQVASLVNLGVVHIIQNNPRMAREYLEHALRLKEEEDPAMMTRVLLNLGVAYDMEGRSEEAIRIYEQGLVHATKGEDAEAMATLYHSIGIAYSMMGDFVRGEAYELKALDANPSPKLRSQILGSLGSFYLEYGSPQKSERCLGEAIELAEREKYWDVLLTCYLNLADFYENQNRDAEANDPLRKYISLKDSIDRKNTSDQLAEQETRFRLDVQKSALEMSEMKSASRRKGLLTLLSTSILLLVVLLMMYRNYRLKQRANALLALEKSRIEKERKILEEENIHLQKENLLARFETLREQINPHFLFNALNSLYALVDTDATRAREFIRQFSLLYRNILEFNDSAVIPFDRELELVNHYLYLQKIRFGDNLVLDVQVDPRMLRLFIPPFTLQMLMENAVKHNEVSAEHPLHIRISTDTDRKVLRVSNSVNSRRTSGAVSTGTGLRNIANRYRILSDRQPEFRLEREEYVAVIPLLEEEV